VGYLGVRVTMITRNRASLRGTIDDHTHRTARSGGSRSSRRSRNRCTYLSHFNRTLRGYGHKLERDELQVSVLCHGSDAHS
jgi:hypothetical protein